MTTPILTPIPVYDETRAKISEAREKKLAEVLTINADLIKALELQEAAELAHMTCSECDGEEMPELCDKCFPLYDDARIARRVALGKIKP